MKRTICLIIILVMIIAVFSVVSNAAARTSGGARARTSTSVKSSSSKIRSSSSTTKSTTIKGVKNINSYKTFTSKYNSSNIKTEKVNSNPTNYTNYSTSNIFRPNVWTAMWLFACMNNNSQEVTEQDIAKELEERGYSQEEVDEILAEGKLAQAEDEQIQKEQEKILNYIAIGVIVFLVIVIIALGISCFMI